MFKALGVLNLGWTRIICTLILRSLVFVFNIDLFVEPTPLKTSYSTVSQALNRDPRFQSLQLHLATLTDLQAMLDQQWPQMRLRVRNLKDGTLSLSAGSAAQAARLRQIEPSILSALQTQGREVTRISFKPQTRSASIEPGNSPKKTISANTLKVISQQSDLITHPAIRAALKHLKSRVRVAV
jgi:Dna[CI] antecedent, DciA